MRERQPGCVWLVHVGAGLSICCASESYRSGSHTTQSAGSVMHCDPQGQSCPSSAQSGGGYVIIHRQAGVGAGVGTGVGAGVGTGVVLLVPSLVLLNPA